MTQPEQRPSPEDIHNAFRGVQLRIRNYAFYNHGRIGPSTRTALQDLDLLEDPPDPIGANIDVEVLRDPAHPQRLPLPSGPLLLYQTQNEKPVRTIVEVPVLLLSELGSVREAAFADLERMIADGSLPITPKTRTVMEQTRAKIHSETSGEWRPAAIALHDAFLEDSLVAFEGVRQCLECGNIDENLKKYAHRLILPSISSIDSISLEVKNPEAEHPRLLEIVASIVREANSLTDACYRYHLQLGYLPLAPPYTMSEIVAQWTAEHPEVDVWTEVWRWARGAFGPIPKYHACVVFVRNPQWIPDGKLPDLWREIVNIVYGSGIQDHEDAAHEPWMLRSDLARHFAYHIEARLPDNNGASIACFAWWFSERAASLFPDDPASAQFYRENWIKPALQISERIWLTAGPHIGRSFLRYVTAIVPSPWATALLSLMDETLDQLAPEEQSDEIRAQFHEALVACLIQALPFAVESPAEPTFAQECNLGLAAFKWAQHQSGDQRKAIEHLVTTSSSLRSVDGLCAALRGMADKSLSDQMVVTLALKAGAYTNPDLAPAVWEVVSDADWRRTVLETVEERVLGLLVEALAVFQIDAREKWSFLLPLYLAELCETTDDDERRRQLFMYVLHTSLAGDTIGAVRKLVNGDQRALFKEIIKDYRAHVEEMWDEYPPWVQGRLRGLLASLHVT